MGVPPNHQYLITCSLTNHSFWGIPIYGNPHLCLFDEAFQLNEAFQPFKGRRISAVPSWHMMLYGATSAGKNGKLKSEFKYDMYIYIYVCVCVLGRERERAREREKKEIEGERERERYIYICIYICIYIYMRVYTYIYIYTQFLNRLMVHRFLVDLFGGPYKSDILSRHVRPNGAQWQQDWRSVTPQETELTPAVLKSASVQNPGCPHVMSEAVVTQYCKQKNKYSMCATQFGKINTALE